MKLLVSDYDNTLELHYDFTDNEEIFKRNINAINEFMKNNLFCVATGRHFDAIYKTLIEKNVKFNYLCANNGAELYDSNYNLLFCLPIVQNDLEILMSLKEKVYFRKPCNNNVVTSANLYFNNLKDYELMRKYLDFNLKESYVEYKYPKIKIINKNCNKLVAINIIQKLENINDKDVYTIGDDINDVKMISCYNGFSLITANKETKEVALKLFDELNELIEYINNK